MSQIVISILALLLLAITCNAQGPSFSAGILRLPPIWKYQQPTKPVFGGVSPLLKAEMPIEKQTAITLGISVSNRAFLFKSGFQAPEYWRFMAMLGLRQYTCLKGKSKGLFLSLNGFALSEGTRSGLDQARKNMEKLTCYGAIASLGGKFTAGRVFVEPAFGLAPQWGKIRSDNPFGEDRIFFSAPICLELTFGLALGKKNQ